MKNTLIGSLLVTAVLISPLSVLAENHTLTINVDTSTSVAAPKYFSGFNTNEVKTTWTYNDPLFQSAVKKLYPKTLRWPAGGAASKFDWRTGDITSAFIERSVALGLSLPTKLEDDYETQAESRSKLGVDLIEFSDLVLKPNKASATIMINSLTDFPELPGSDYAASARDLAAYARDNGVPVEYWELMNEPYLKNKLLFWDLIGIELGMSKDGGESLGHYNGRVYMAWTKIFSDAIKSQIPAAKTVVMFAPGKLADQTYKGETDLDYQTHFNDAIWEYGQTNGTFWNAMSFHWYPCYPIYEGEETMEGAEKCLNGNIKYLESTIGDYYIPKNTEYLGNANMPIIITETNVSPDSPIMGTLFNTVYISEMLGRLSAYPQVKSINIQSMAANGAIHWGAFRLLNQGYWADVSEDTYASTPENILPKAQPFFDAGLVSFTSQYTDAGRETGVIDLKNVPTLPDFATNPAFSNYKIINTINGEALKFVNEIFFDAKSSFPISVTSGTQATVMYGEQPQLPVATDIGGSITVGDALYMRGFLSRTNVRRILITNKSGDTHTVSINWAGIPPTTKVTHISISNPDKLLKNTDAAPTSVTSTTTSILTPVTIGPYSVNVINLKK